MCSKSCGILSSSSVSVRLSTLSGPLRREHFLHQLRLSAGGFVCGDQVYEPLPGAGYRSVACE